MTPTLRCTAVPFAALLLFAGLLLGQQNEGIPVTDTVVIAKCGSCHARDARGIMERISFSRTTPEGWQDEVKQMILLNGLELTPAEARSIVKYLSASHGLAPEEAKPVMYDPERRIHEETNIPTETLRDACAKCHEFARVLEWRRSSDDWKQFLDAHATRYKARRKEEAFEFLTKTAPLHTPEWNSWNVQARTLNIAGRWLATAHIPGRGDYFGEIQIDRAGDDEFTTRVNLKSVKDGTAIVRSGRSAVFGANAWRGRSSGTVAAGGAPDDPLSESREVMWIAPDQSSIEGRWFWGQYQEFEFNVKMQRGSSDPKVLLVDRASLKTGSQASRVRILGDNLPAAMTPADLTFGPGIIVRRIVSRAPREIVAEVDVAADATPGKRDLTLRQSVLPGAIAIYDRVDYVRVTPESTVAAFGDKTRLKGYMQFEAIGYQRGADGKSHTPDDVPLGPVDVAWAVQVFHDADDSSSKLIGTISPSGLFTPATDHPNINFDCWAIATARDEKNQSGDPLVGKSYMVVTIPSYTFNGRRYVRDRDRWVDDGPATAADTTGDTK